MPVDALELSAPSGQCIVFALRQRRPHVVEGLEIGIDVECEIVRELPGAEGVIVGRKAMRPMAGSASGAK
jgi:hypothetical protein